MPPQPPPRPPPPMPWPRILMAATYRRHLAGLVGQAEPPTAWTPPSTCTISPVVIGKRSLKRARQALATAVESWMSHPSGARSAQVSSKALNPGIDEIHPDAAGPELLGQVARQRLEPRLGHAHPVVDGPGHRRIEVETDDGRATVGPRGLQERQERLGQCLERI